MNSRISPRITHPKNDSAARPPGKHGTMEIQGASKQQQHCSTTVMFHRCPWTMVNDLNHQHLGSHEMSVGTAKGPVEFSKMFL